MALAKKSLEILTETMFYVLMAFLKTDMCGTDVAAFIDQKTKGRIQMGPGTLYTILAKFQSEGLLEETEIQGRKRTYRITHRGTAHLRRGSGTAPPLSAGCGGGGAHRVVNKRRSFL